MRVRHTRAFSLVWLRGYTLAEVALTMPAALMVVSICIGSLHLSAKLLEDCTKAFDGYTLALLHLRREFSSCIVASAQTTNGFELFDCWGRRRSPRQLSRGTGAFAVRSIDIDIQDGGLETHSARGVVVLVQYDFQGKYEELPIAARLASEYEADCLEEYGQNTLP